MNDKVKNILSLMCNIFLFVAMIVSILLYLVKSSPYHMTGMFKYYTNLSNIFLGFAAGCYVPYNIMKLAKPSSEISFKWVTISKYFATITTSITFIVVLVFLGPIYGYPALFGNPQNILFHGICPVVGAVSLLLFDPVCKIDFKYLFIAFVPTIAYGIFYIINYAVNKEDFYKFFGFGAGGFVLVIIGILGSVFGFAFLYRFIINRNINKKSLTESAKL